MKNTMTMKRYSTQPASERQNNHEGTSQPFVRGDPLTRLVIERLQLGIGKATFLLILVLNIPIFIVATINNLWLTDTSQIGLLFDYAWWGFHITLVPATIYFFLWMPTGIYRTINNLIENKTIIFSKKKSTTQKIFREFIEDFDSWYSHPGWLIACLTINLVGSLFISIPVHSVYRTWETANSFIFWYVVMFYWVVIYCMITLAALRYILTIIWLNRMFKRFQVNVRVLHPDGAGGLSPLGNFSVKTGYVLGLYGIASMWAMITEPYSINMQFSGFAYNPIILIWQICFICLSPIIFFAPVGAAHTSMKKAKESFVTQISNQFEIDIAGIKKILASDTSSFDERIKKIKQLQELHDIASRFPVWPFNIANLVRFFSAVLSPVALGLIPTVVEFVLK